MGPWMESYIFFHGLDSSTSMSFLQNKVQHKTRLWYGHIERMLGFRYTKQIYQGEVVGTRPIGRPKKVLVTGRAGRTE